MVLALTNELRQETRNENESGLGDAEKGANMPAVSSGSHLLRSESCVAESAWRDEPLSKFLSRRTGVERPKRTMSFRLLNQVKLLVENKRQVGLKTCRRVRFSKTAKASAVDLRIGVRSALQGVELCEHSTSLSMPSQ